MRVSVSWLREHVELPAGLTADELEKALVKVGLEVEELVDLASTVTGDLVVGRVEAIEELTGHKKKIRYCQVDVGRGSRGIVCGARNFEEGDLVVVALPGAVLPGGFAIAARTTYGHVSDGMICSGRELGISDDHDGILVLPAGSAAPGSSAPGSSAPGSSAPGGGAVAAPVPGADARPLLGLDDVVVELAITPDRGYCFAVRGIARELSHSLGTPFSDPAASVVPVDGGDGSPVYDIQVDDPAGCDRFTAVAVRGVDPTAPSPEWMRRRLATAGVRSISLAVDITNYLMLDLGQPMHAWDLQALTGPLVVRRARAGERLKTLDGADRALDPEDLVIADDTGVVSLAAVMGGATTEVSDTTVDVLFEAAHWDPVSVARTSRRHRLTSEASKRFERGVDPQITAVACARAAELMVEYGGGTLDPRITDVYSVAAPAPVEIDAMLPSRIAGVDYPAARVVELLSGIGASVEAAGDRLVVTPPSWRPDLTDPADLAEEVIRLDGYDRVGSVLPQAPVGGGLTPVQRRRRSVGRALAEAGYVEVLCYPFIGDAALDALGITDDDPRRSLVRLRNPISDEEPALRTTLLGPLLGTLRRNLGRVPGGRRDVALYEIGRVFHPRPGAAGRTAPDLGVAARPSDEELAAAEELLPDQPWHVAAVLAGDSAPAGWWGPGRPADWSDAIQAARTVAAAAGATVTVRAAANAPWHPGRCAEVLVDGVAIGHAGELHPAVCAALELPKRTCAMELNLDALPLPEVVQAPVVSAFPPALFDLALVVDAKVPVAEVEAALRDGAGDLLESVRLFDVYTGPQVGEGRKSLAYSLTLRASDRTLTGDDATAARDGAVSVAAERVNASLRGA